MENARDILVIPVEGDLDVTTVPRVRACLENGLRHGSRRVILSLADASYVDSAGMGFILATARRVRARGGAVSLINVRREVYRALVISRLVDFIPVSGLAPNPPIPALDPAVRPLWHGTVRVDPSGLAEARRRLERLLSHTDLTGEEAFDLTLAAGEALGNAVDHTCADGVLLSGLLYPDRVIVEVTDCGCGFQLADGEEPECASGEDSVERGRGIKLMRMLADSVEITHKSSGPGTVVRLVKLLTPSAAPVVAAGEGPSAAAPAPSAHATANSPALGAEPEATGVGLSR